MKQRVIFVHFTNTFNSDIHFEKNGSRFGILRPSKIQQAEFVLLLKIWIDLYNQIIPIIDDH